MLRLESLPGQENMIIYSGFTVSALATYLVPYQLQHIITCL